MTNQSAEETGISELDQMTRAFIAELLKGDEKDRQLAIQYRLFCMENRGQSFSCSIKKPLADVADPTGANHIPKENR